MDASYSPNYDLTSPWTIAVAMAALLCCDGVVCSLTADG